MAFKNASSVGVHHENRMLASVKQNGIRRLRTQAVQRKQFLSQFLDGLREQATERSPMALVNKFYKRLQPCRFLPEISRRPNQSLELLQRDGPDCCEIQPTRGPQTTQGNLDILP